MEEIMILELVEDGNMGRVTTHIRVENLKDLWEVEQGRRSSDQTRAVDVVDALVDTGASLLSLPTRLINQLGLRKTRDRTVVTTRGITTASIYEAVRLTIMGRDCVVEVIEVPDAV